MGPSATSATVRPSMFNPFHLRCRLCRPPEVSKKNSPPVPIYKRPSAVPAAIIPVGDIDRQSMNGGDKETPEDGGAAAKTGNQYTHA